MNNNNNNNNNNEIIGNGAVPHEFSQRPSIDHLSHRPKKVADVPAVERYNWLLHKHYIRHEYKITINLIDEELTNSNGHNEYANYLKGLILRREGRIQESLECFRNSCNINSTNVRHVKQIAKSLFLLGDHKRAIEAYLQADKMSNSQDWEIHHSLGECYVTLHSAEEAMQEMLKATELTNDKVPHVALARLAISENKIDEAIQVYRRTLQVSGDSNEALIQLGFVYLQQDDTHRAFQAFGTVLARSPLCVEATIPMAYIIQRHKEYDVALSKYKNTAHMYPESWQLWNNIGMCFSGKRKSVAAVTCLKRAHYLNPMAWQSACNLGKVLLQTGQPASAAVYSCAAISAVPYNPMPYLLLGLALKKLDDIEGAERALSKAHSLTSQDPVVLINYAIILQSKNNIARLAEIMSDFQNVCSQGNVDLTIIEAAEQVSRRMKQISDT